MATCTGTVICAYGRLECITCSRITCDIICGMKLCFVLHYDGYVDHELYQTQTYQNWNNFRYC